jgi:hypothetical protein
MPNIKPQSDESEADFVKRAHQALFDEFPDSDKRNAAVFGLWREHRGASDEEKRAYEKFGDDEFAHILNVPHFKEHEYPWMPRNADGSPKLDEDGQPIVRKEVYDFDSLRRICENMNDRIADTGDFPPLTDKHSPKKGSEESKPRLVGFAGPFGMGMVGNVNPRWAIVAKQEHWFKDKSYLAREMPRRSAEVYLGRPMEHRILDPVTVLGADTPALDMGIHYAAAQNNAASEEFDLDAIDQHAYYSGPPILATYAGPCFAGGANTFVPAFGTKKKANYSEEPPAPASPAAPAAQTQGTPSMLSPEDANVIIKALMETEPMQWVIGKMQEDMAPKQDTPDQKLNDPAMAQPAPKEQLSEEESPVIEPGQETLRGDGDPDPNDTNDEIPPMPEKDKQKKVGYSERDQERIETVKYSALEAKVAALEADNAKIKLEKAQSERKSRISSLRMAGLDIDVDEEVQRCSLENMPTDREFDNHLDVIAKYAAKMPINMALHLPDAPIIEDRRAAEVRKQSRNGEPAFMATPEFADEVTQYAELKMAEPNYKPSATDFFVYREAVKQQWLARGVAPAAATVG